MGIEVAKSSQGIFLPQWNHVLHLLSKVGMVDCKLINTLIVQNHKLEEHLDRVPTNKERCKILVGKLIYLSHTCLDIAIMLSA